ncbi:MAG: hypothetical protein U0Q16_06005 [Bryobacteraceae bacterium]
MAMLPEVVLMNIETLLRPAGFTRILLNVNAVRPFAGMVKENEPKAMVLLPPRNGEPPMVCVPDAVSAVSTASIRSLVILFVTGALDVRLNEPVTTAPAVPRQGSTMTPTNSDTPSARIWRGSEVTSQKSCC